MKVAENHAKAAEFSQGRGWRLAIKIFALDVYRDAANTVFLDWR